MYLSRALIVVVVLVILGQVYVWYEGLTGSDGKFLEHYPSKSSTQQLLLSRK